MCVFQRGGDIQSQDPTIKDGSNADKNLLQNRTNTSDPKNQSPIYRAPLTVDNLDFGVNVSNLKELMQLKGQDAKENLTNKLGGIEKLAQSLRVDLEMGLDTNNKTDLDMRLKKFGKNEIPPKSPKNIFRLMFDALQDTTLIMLIVCAIISIGLAFYDPGTGGGHSSIEWVEGVAIMIAVVVVVFVTAFNDWRKERQFRGLQNKIDQNRLITFTHKIKNNKIG
jgi:magnesium-transporting ATPase (P-type)